MDKILLIIKREYLTRVRNKTFLLTTFLLPIVILLFIFGTAFLAASTPEKLKKIAVINDPGMFKSNLKNDAGHLNFDFTTTLDSVGFKNSGYDALLDLNNDSISKNFTILSKEELDIKTKEMIEARLDMAFENNLLEKKGIHKEILDSIIDQSTGSFTINNRRVSDRGSSEQVNASLNYGIGFSSGFLIYITMIIFGAMVMRGVMEEKTNRIAEVIISSVKPFQLMMGKIIGIASVGLTQFLLWIILIVILLPVLSSFLPHALMQNAIEASQNIHSGPGNSALMKALELKQMADSVNWLRIICYFLFYFLGGYFFYASLFAAVGSVSNEDSQGAQSLMLPIMMPIIFSFIILSSNLTTPNSKIMVWASIIPFTSPVVMMGRIASGTPWEQLVASMFFLIAGFVFTTWIAGKIYRIGILMYGKRFSWKEMLKWAFHKS
jgi:ABC-2 type transport system permease protein